MNRMNLGSRRHPAWVPMSILLVSLTMGACSTDSPTSPTQPVTTVSPSGPQGVTAWNIQVTVTPNDVEISGTPFEATVRALARRQSNGQLAPNGATIILTTTIGGFTSTDAAGTGTTSRSIVTRTNNGEVSAFLQFDGTIAGAAVVQAQLEQSFSQAVVQLREPPPPPPEPVPIPPPPFFIAEVRPNVGGPAGGEGVNILGSGFSGPIRVTFGGLPATVTGASPEIIHVIAPAVDLGVGEVRSVPVTVTINLNDTNPDEATATDSLANAYTYARGGQTIIPRIFSLTPTSGPNEGGTEIVINGEGFSNQVQVFVTDVGNVEAPIVSISPTRLVVRTPSATGSNFINLNAIVGVRVINLDSGLEATLAGAFQYGDGQARGPIITSAGPTQGTYAGGQTVTIFGTGFDEPVAVSFGGFAQQEINVTGTEIVARSGRVILTGCSATSGAFSVTNIETGESFVSGIVYTYMPVNVAVGGLVPASVATDSNGNLVVPTSVTISGVSGFADGDVVSVEFGDGFAFNAMYNGSTNQITADVPPFTGSFGAMEDCTTGNGLPGMRPGPERVDVRISNGQTGCELILTSRFTYTPDGTCVATEDPTPLIIGLSTVSGSSNGGTPVTISGQNFISPVRVLFGGATAPSATVSGTTSISTSTPQYTGAFPTEPCDDNLDLIQGARNLPVQVGVTVINLTSGNQDTLPNAFTFMPADTSCIGD